MPAADAGLRVKSATVYTAENSFGKFPPLPVPLHIVPGGEHVARLVRFLPRFGKLYGPPIRENIRIPRLHEPDIHFGRMNLEHPLAIAQLHHD